MRSWSSIIFGGMTKPDEAQTYVPCYIEAGIEDVNKETNKETDQSFGSL